MFYQMIQLVVTVFSEEEIGFDVGYRDKFEVSNVLVFWVGANDDFSGNFDFFLILVNLNFPHFPVIESHSFLDNFILFSHKWGILSKRRIFSRQKRSIGMKLSLSKSGGISQIELSRRHFLFDLFQVLKLLKVFFCRVCWFRIF